MGAHGFSVRPFLVLACTIGLLATLPVDAVAAAPPAVSGETFTKVGETEVDLHAFVNPESAPTTYHVEYGTSETYGSSTAESKSVGSDAKDHAVTVHLGGLSAGTTYHFRFVATNEAASTDGEDRPFVTYPAAPPPSGGDCANEARRQEQNGTYLPDCRAYELVSPVEKDGSNVISATSLTTKMSDNGERVSYYMSAGVAEGDKGSGFLGYTVNLASRGDGGWSSKAITPLASTEAFQLSLGSTNIYGFSKDLGAAVLLGYDLPHSSGLGTKTINYYHEDTVSGALQTVTLTPPGTFVGFFGYEGDLRSYSADGKTVLFESFAELLPEATGLSQKLYAWTEGQLYLVGILPDGTAPAGGSNAAGGQTFLPLLGNRSSVSDDGSRIAFLSSAGGPDLQLYLRREHSSTAWVSASETSVPNPEPHGVRFQEMSPDGKKILFLSTDPLTDSDPGGAGYGLYLYTDGPNPEAESNLTFIARVQQPLSGNNVIGASSDFRKIYFYSGFSESHEGTYLWDEGGLKLVARTDSKPGERVKQGNNEYSEGTEVSADGEVLSFMTNESLIPGLRLGEEDDVMMVYDARTEKLTCASCPPTGADPSAPVKVVPGTMFLGQQLVVQDKPRFMSSDGSRVFFATADPLAEQDVNGVQDVYEYVTQTGKVSLLSPGTESKGVGFVSASVSGNDVVVSSKDQLLAGDIDTLADIYDVRVGGGFVQPKPKVEGCVGDECQGIPSAVPTFSTASGFSGLGNVAKSGNSSKHRTKALTRAQKLVRALRACKHKRGNVRRRCRAQAKRRYGPIAKARKGAPTATRG